MSGVRDKSQGIAFQATGKAKTRILDTIKRTKVYKSFDEEALHAEQKETAASSADDQDLATSLELIAADIFRHLDNHVEPATVLLWVSQDIKKLIKG